MTDPRALAIADHTYVLPPERIAQRPLEERDAARLLQYRDGTITDHRFSELAELLPPDTLLVLNDTRVVNARLVLHRSTGARIEVLCLTPADGGAVEAAFAQRGTATWNAFVGNAKRWKEGEELILNSTTATGEDLVLRARRSGPETVTFTWEPTEMAFAEVLDRVGHVPLPPYMQRPDEPGDMDRYNTVFARDKGSVAAPTASLHFTQRLLDAFAAKSIATARLTLHVGAGTFLPVKSERMAEHTMHSEQVRVPLSVLEALAAQPGRGPVVPVGTTALRTLESIYWHGVMLMQGRAGVELAVGQWEPYDHAVDALPTAEQALAAVIEQVRNSGSGRLVGSTSLLIAPGYRFRFADGLVTNFHQPQSTLLLLVAAFVGPDWRRIYDHALTAGYRFLSYGDGSLLWRNGHAR
jgi:S-adenosylmethionine:tRNA ribosyltransferase-isomerase